MKRGLLNDEWTTGSFSGSLISARSYVRRSYIKPGGHPDVFDAEQQPDHDFHRQREHDYQKDLHGGVLQHAHARVDLAVERRARDQLCLLYTSPSPRDGLLSRMPSSA